MRDRIVVGLDGSPGAQAAVDWAVRLRDALGAEVVAVHAVGLLEARHERDRPAGAEAADRVEIVDGPAVDVLLRAAERERAALVVVGARALDDHPERALGSTSLRVLQGAGVPTLVVPASAPTGTAAPRLRHVLVGVDRSPASLAALEVAAELAGVFGGSLSVVEAFPLEPPFPLGTSAAGPGGEQEHEHELRRTAAAVEELVRTIRDRGIAVQVVVRSGEPAATLARVADDVGADLAVVGSRGGGDPADPLLGSVARAVAAHGRRPTLVVPAAAGRVRFTAAAGGDA
jgi:nucleotide-binding universal stress UspA family protein